LAKIEEGSFVLLFHTPRKKWLARVTQDKKLHTHLGIIDISAAIGMEYGSAVRTTEDKLIFLIEPTIHDFIMKSERRTQIVYPKDLGYIAARIGLKNGSKVLKSEQAAPRWRRLWQASSSRKATFTVST